MIKDTVETNVPSKTIKDNTKLPWISNNIRRLMRRRKRAYNKYKRSKSNYNWERYKDLQNTVKDEIAQSHTRYIERIFSSDNDEKVVNKKSWSYIKKLRKDSVGIPTLKSNGKEATKAKEKAEVLGKQYKSVFTKEDTSSIPTLENSLPTMPKIVIESKGVEKLLSQLNPQKAIGPDQIPTRILKDHRTIVAPILTVIYQQSLETGCVPTDWKTANVVPVFKGGEKHVPSNYRPVSLTSIACKALEHIVFSRLMSWNI